jgi:bifunctional DNA-binding transcriptional regulator/antitoxin component of YhaV-PrlF toxin-antitoxin module
MTHRVLDAEARLRAKSQLTIPEQVVDAIGLQQGDRFLIELSADEPDVIRLHRIRDSYAGGLRDVFGKTSEYLSEERRTWERE